MKGYFWANLKGTIVNWEVRRFRLYRNAHPMDILWEGALETGAVDEILLVVSPRSAHLGQIMKDAGAAGGVGSDPLKEHPKYPEAFLTVTDGRHVKDAKFRLKGISFEQSYRLLADDPAYDPYLDPGEAGGGHRKTPGGDVFQILVRLEKVERTRVALPGM